MNDPGVLVIILLGLGASAGSIIGIVALAKRMKPGNQLLYAFLIVVLLMVSFAGLATAGCGAVLGNSHF